MSMLFFFISLMIYIPLECLVRCFLQKDDNKAKSSSFTPCFYIKCNISMVCFSEMVIGCHSEGKLRIDNVPKPITSKRLPF